MLSGINQNFEPPLVMVGGEGHGGADENGEGGGVDVDNCSRREENVQSDMANEMNVDVDVEVGDKDEDEDWDGHGGAGDGNVANIIRTLKKGQLKKRNANIDVDVGHEDGDGGGSGDKAKCSRGGKKLQSNMGAKVNIDVEDGDENGGEDDIDDMFDEIDEGNNSSMHIQLATDPITETQVLSTATIHLLSTLAGSCRAVTSTTSTVFNNAAKVLASLVTGHSWDSIQTTFHTDSLLGIALRCGISENLVESSQLIFSLNLIQFRTKIES